MVEAEDVDVVGGIGRRWRMERPSTARIEAVDGGGTYAFPLAPVRERLLLGLVDAED